MNESNENFYLTTTPIKKLLIKFSIPCVLAMLVSALYNIVDQIFIGNSSSGTSGIMATTLVFPFTVVALAIAQLIGDGCATLFSISLGAKDEKTSNKCVGNAIIAVILFSIILVAVGFIFMKQSIDKPYKAMILSLMRDVIILVPGVCILGLCGNLYTMLWAGPLSDIGAFVVTVIFATIECRKINKLAKENVAENNAETERTNNIKDKFVISIGREFGSGGKYIGQELAKRLNIKCYDNELLSKVSENYNIDMETLEKVDEKQKSSFWYGFATNYVFSKNNEVSPISAEDNLFLKQAKVIEDLYYNPESSIIVGRCSDYILKDKDNVIKLFVYSSDMDFKIDRKMKLENLNKVIAEKKIKQVDKQRAEYYKHFTSQTWGDRSNYDLCIDTSKLGVDETIDVIESYIRKRVG